MAILNQSDPNNLASGGGQYQNDFTPRNPDGTPMTGAVQQAPGTAGDYSAPNSPPTLPPGTTPATPGATTPPPTATGTPAATAFDPNSWVTSALTSAKSTDDPSYWQGKISSDPNVQNPATRDSALAYWQGRINQGNGAGLGLPLFNDSGTMGAGAGGANTPLDIGALLAKFGGNYQQSPQDSQLFNMLMGRAQQSLNVDPNDPVIKGQVDAYRAEQNRGAKDFISQAAERGGPQSNMDAQARSAYEKAGQATSGLQSQLMQNELNSRRTEIQNALSEQGSLLSAQDQMALQKELGLINSQIAAQGQANQFSLGQQGINSQNDQFNATYGLNATNQGNYWDALRSGLL